MLVRRPRQPILAPDRRGLGHDVPCARGAEAPGYEADGARYAMGARQRPGARPGAMERGGAMRA
jgi:hypothetical protein